MAIKRLLLATGAFGFATVFAGCSSSDEVSAADPGADTSVSSDGSSDTSTTPDDASGDVHVDVGIDVMADAATDTSSPKGLSITPSSNDLGSVVIGGTIDTTLTVANGGSVTSGSVAFAWSGSDKDLFSLLAGGSCKTDGTQTLAGGASCTVKVQFKATSEGMKSASLQASASPGGSATASFTAAAMRPLAQITAGAEHTCARWTDGSFKCWGWNAYGQLGDGTTTERHSPQAVPGLSVVAQISAGHGHTCARLSDGSSKCWGDNNNGPLGDGTTMNRLSPVAVTGLSGVADVVAGGGRTCARWTTDGSVKCWGGNLLGELGDGSTTPRSTPVVISGLSGAAEIALGGDHTCARWSTDGSVKCTGGNAFGQLGDGSTMNLHSPVAVPGLSSVVQIVVGYTHTCALLTGGTVKCWGNNEFGQLGDGTTANRVSPVATMITTVAQIASNSDHTCAVLTDGTVKCWGNNSNGQLGDGTKTNRSSPVPVAGLSGVAEIALGSTHTCARLTNGTVQCWGSNAAGELGDGTIKEHLAPAPVKW